MPMSPLKKVVQRLRRAALLQDGAGQTDGQLLAWFIRDRDPAAFEALVRRHGPMVMSVCRRLLRNHHDAEDAFQATFLVLVRKATAIVPPEKLANWLHGVAYHTALKARAIRAKQSRREKQVPALPEPVAVQPEDCHHELLSLLDQQLRHLPDKYRVPIILCDLEGRPIKEAAWHLGWPQGTLAGRLARGRKMLAKRLTRRGVVLPTGALAVALAENAGMACAPSPLVASTVKAAETFVTVQAGITGMIPIQVVALTEGVLKGMFMLKIKSLMMGLLVVGLAASGVGVTTSLSNTNAAEAEIPNKANNQNPDWTKIQQPVSPAQGARAGLSVPRLESPGFATTIQEIVYNGAKHLKPAELQTITNLHKGAPLNPIANRMATKAIRRRYETMGRLFADVDLVEGDKIGDTRVVFNITEGPVVHVSSIAFVGNTFVSGARLNTQINSTRQFLGLLGGRFDPVTADHGAMKLEEYYKRHGFQDVHVSREFQWEEDHRHVRLVFRICEGLRYHVSAVQVKGNKIVNEDLLLSQSKLHPGDYYSKDKADADMAIIHAPYRNRGYAVTVHEHDFTTSPGQVAVHYEVQEKPPARVGEIRVIENDVTRQNVILRQVPLYSGRVLTYPDLRLPERNLAKLGIFETNAQTGVRPTVSVIDPDSDTEFKDILVQVQEQPTGSLIFGVGVNSDAGLTGSIVPNERKQKP